MSNYTKTTNFTVKDGLPSGDPAKLVKGVDFDVEFNAIATAIATKSDAPVATEALTLPVGTTAQRPSSPANGQARYNTTLSVYEFYNGSAWEQFVPQDATDGAASLPVGTTAQRPVTPATGMFRYNSTNQSFEGYDGSSWGSVGGASGGGGNPFIYLNDQVVSVDYTIPSDKNGMTAGPITVDSGVTVTISTGAVWTVI